jgi:transcription antitermination factor NusG
MKMKIDEAENDVSRNDPVIGRTDINKVFSDEDPRSWFAVYTKSRHEKKVNWTLTEKNVETFLPLREVLVRWKDRIKRVHVPLFPGYLFVRIDPKERLSVLGASGVVCILGNHGMPVPVPLHEIESTRKLLRSGLKFRDFPYEMEGKEVVIVSGPLEGARGKVLFARGGCNLILSVNLIRRSVSVEVDMNDVEFV